MSSLSSNTVYFGVVVRTADLVAANLAAQSLEPTLTAIDLIALRRHAGTFHCDLTAGVVDTGVSGVPKEVWGLVKGFLLESAVLDARAEVQAKVSCDWCVSHARDRAINGNGPLKWEMYQPVMDVFESHARACRRTHVGEPDWADHADADQFNEYHEWCGRQKHIDQVWAELVKGVEGEVSLHVGMDSRLAGGPS
jgi:hypothetical protein